MKQSLQSCLFLYEEAKATQITGFVQVTKFMSGKRGQKYSPSIPQSRRLCSGKFQSTAHPPLPNCIFRNTCFILKFQTHMQIERYVSTYFLKHFQTSSLSLFFWFCSWSLFLTRKLNIKASFCNFLKDGAVLCFGDLSTSSNLVVPQAVRFSIFKHLYFHLPFITYHLLPVKILALSTRKCLNIINCTPNKKRTVIGTLWQFC